MRSPICVDYNDLHDLKNTVSLIESWAGWAKSGGRGGRVVANGAHHRYPLESVYAHETVAYDHNLKEILACNKAWTRLPWREKRLIQCYYLWQMTIDQLCRQCNLKKTNFLEQRRKAVLMIRNRMA